MSTDEENEVVTVKQMHLDYLHRLAGNPGPRSVEGFEEIRLPNNKGPQVEFLGKIRAEYDTQNKHRTNSVGRRSAYGRRPSAIGSLRASVAPTMMVRSISPMWAYFRLTSLAANWR